jgi:hypothetical protein
MIPDDNILGAGDFRFHAPDASLKLELTFQDSCGHPQGEIRQVRDHKGTIRRNEERP